MYFLTAVKKNVLSRVTSFKDRKNSVKQSNESTELIFLDQSNPYRQFMLL